MNCISEQLSLDNTIYLCRHSKRMNEWCNADYFLHLIINLIPGMSEEQRLEIAQLKPVSIQNAIYYKYLKEWINNYTPSNFIQVAEIGLTSVLKLYILQDKISETSDKLNAQTVEMAFVQACLNGKIATAQLLFDSYTIQLSLIKRLLKYINQGTIVAQWLYCVTLTG